MHQGTLTVKPWNQNKIIIEAEKIGTAQELKDTSIAIKAPVAQAKPSHLTITTRGIPEQKAATVNYTLMVPEHTALLVRSSSQGIVKIKQLDGSLDISLAEGDIDIANATTSVSAKTGKGTIKLKQKKLGERESIFLENGQGDVYIYLPRETQATVHARTLNGTVTSAHAITLQPQTVRLNKETWERIKKEVDGTLGTGGAPITLEATKGNISIEEY
jgi:hypothetical protein